MLNTCPACGGDLVVDRYQCESCDTRIEGRFNNSAIPGLTSDQLEFVETFVRCEGKITRMEAELGLSYPTIRNRLQDVIRAMGFEPRRDDATEAAAKRRAVLNDLDAGRIFDDEAMRALREG
ncbi:MAG: DUF2089 domain-containing protein [Chloroflexota bacterium]